MIYPAGAGYTGLARRGHSLSAVRSGEPLEVEPCPTCGKPCTVERYESTVSGRVLSVRRLWCPTQKRGRKTRFSDPTAGACPVYKEEVELTKKTDEHKVERDKLRELRKRLGLTNHRIGELADVSQGSLDHWLCGNVVSVDVAQRLAAVVARLEAQANEFTCYDRELESFKSQASSLAGSERPEPAGGIMQFKDDAVGFAGHLIDQLELPPEAGAVLVKPSVFAGSPNRPVEEEAREPLPLVGQVAPERLREFEAAAGQLRVLEAVKMLAELEPAKQEAALTLLARLTEANRAEAELLEALAS